MKFERTLNSRTTFQGRVTGALLLILMTQGTMPAWAGGKAINVQGKLTDSAGNPLAGAQAVTFRLYKNPAGPASTCDANDPNCVWSESQGVTPQNGLFNATLGNANSLDAIPFNAPYYLGMQVAGDNNELSPRQLLGASAYALGSLGDFNVQGNLASNGNISANANISVTGNVSASSMSVRGQDVRSFLVPSGTIALFAGDCPAGWTRFSALDNRFPMGAPSFGQGGGLSTHNHSINMDGSHNHGGATGGSTVNDNGQWLFGNNQGSGSHLNNFADAAHGHGIGMDGAHNHGGVTGPSNNLPPYLSMVFCQNSMSAGASPIASVPAGGVTTSTTPITSLLGTTTNDNAAPGTVGQYGIARIVRSSPISLTNNVTANITSFSLTAGDYLVVGMVGCSSGSGGSVSQIQGGISLTSATLPALDTIDAPTGNEVRALFAYTSPTNDISIGPMIERISLSSTTTLFLVGQATIIGSMGGFGSLQWWRIR